ncbi:MAG: SRPBCC domain-containing protein [Chloroflexi bacterium]|nr:SRPBCC domain-containing protein [Chloroflexota bacterium]
MTTKTLKFKLHINVPISEVYRAFAHQTLWQDWFSDTCQCEPRVGGRLYWYWREGFYALGTYTALEPHKKIAFTWDGKGEPAPTKVQITLTEKEGGTTVTLSHSRIGSGGKWKQTIRDIENGWNESLANLKSVLEEGIDLRTARLPRLGIFIGDFNVEIAQKIGVPVQAGVRLEGTAENSGARAAGLQKDDVMVKFAGKTMKTPNDLAPALQGKLAGDKVPVMFYRGGEKKTVMLELSQRPLLQPPANPAEFVELTKKNAAKVGDEIAKLLEGVTEAQAEVRPAPEEWNIKELIAHIICTERDLQSWLADMLNDNQRVSDFFEFRPNVNPRLRALVKRYNSVQALRDELKNAQQETIDYLSALPDSFYKRPHFYRRLALWIMEIIPNHVTSEHGEQIQRTLEAARK